MHYLIDGYNLLHQVGVLTGPVGPNGLEKARLALLGRLHGHYGDDAGRVTVVFDAAGAPPGVPNRSDYHGIRVHFTRSGEADDLIEDLIRRCSVPRLLTVVSNDHRLGDAARRRGCPVVECVAYWESLGSPRPTRPPPARDPGAKPERVSGAELEQLLRDFGDLEDDDAFEELFGPSDFDEG
jgi:hypothetical protein